MRPRRPPVAPGGPRQGPDLDKALALVVGEYERFMAANPPCFDDDSEPRSFGARHAAGRAALGHLEQIVRIAQLLNPSPAAGSGIAALLAEARHHLALNAHPDEETETDESAPDE